MEPVTRSGKAQMNVMSSHNYLFIFIVLLCTLTSYLITVSNVTDEDRDEMLNGKDWF